MSVEAEGLAMVPWQAIGEARWSVPRPRWQRRLADMGALLILSASAAALWSLETTGAVSARGGRKVPAVGATRWVYRAAYAGMGVVGASACVLQVRRPWLVAGERGLLAAGRVLPWSEAFRCRWDPSIPGRLVVRLGPKRIAFRVPPEAREGLQRILEERGKWEPTGAARGRPAL